MDPVSGVGLVAAVVQLVHTGIKIAKACHEIYEKGQMNPSCLRFVLF